ncbi:NACHT, LRR and PYD domains-containing protein 1 homolog [Megalobrama amblycephala]|uniref:NACHT, LRR and PYD domains-containing protein 1 homolog n=1 Tax=Megalobrama amblycephala TaxID=75352 RepID=UPI0020147246|nr:NACHT, LRR and PYD domains-containing protein 1 homolog [Megalobrama amblycephala]
MDNFNMFVSNKDIVRSDAGPNVSAAAQSGSQITAPVLTNNTITGDVNIIHNTPSSTSNGPPSETTQTSATRSVILKYKELICREYQCVTEYNSLPGEHVLLSECYTQPLILQRHRDQKEREEEIRSSGESFQQVLSARSSDDSVHLNSLFDPHGHGIRPSAVILQGNSGNGKSFTVQKIMMDWASGDLYKERFDVVFHLKCKEINRICGIKSLEEILSCSCSLTSDQISQVLQHSPEKMLFIIDGFDELRLTQDINDMSPHTDLLQKAPAEVILCDLLRGRILPESFLLVTSRSTATDTLSKLLKGPQRFSEIMGFSEKGVEEYFQKFFQNEELFRKAYTLVKTNETLITACSIPVVCWIICTTIKERLKTAADVTSGLETTTSIYVDFVCTLLKHHCQGSSQSIPTLLRSLGQLAERGMLEQQVLLDKKSVYETVSDPAGSPFLCKFLFKRRIHQETMFSFMHLSFQEFFTALYYVLLDEEESQRKFTQLFPIDEKSNHYDIRRSHFSAVVQFAFGLLNKDARCTLEEHDLFVHSKTQTHMKEWILKMGQIKDSHNRLLYLHCLYELHEEDFVKKAMETWKRIDADDQFISRTDCWVLLYCSQFCQCIEELNLTGCRLSSENFRMILAVYHKFKKVRLNVEVSTDSDLDLDELMYALVREQTLRSLSIDVYFIFRKFEDCYLQLSIDEEISICIETSSSLESLTLTFQCREPINIEWAKLIQIIHQEDSDALMSVLDSFSELKKMKMILDCLSKMWTHWILQIIQSCSSLTLLDLYVQVSSDSDLVVDELMYALTREQTLRSLSIDVYFIFRKFDNYSLHLTNNEEISVRIETSASFDSLTLTFQCPEPINIEWAKLIQIIHQGDSDALMSVLCSFSELKKINMKLHCLSKMWTHCILQIIQNCSSLTELKLNIEVSTGSDLVVDELMYALTREQTLRSLSIDVYFIFRKFDKYSLHLSNNEEISVRIETSSSLESLTLTFQCPEPINIEWAKLTQIIHQEDSDALMSVFCSFSKLKKMEMKLLCLSEMWSHCILQIIQNCSSLTELEVDADIFLEEGIQILQRSRPRPGCSVTFHGHLFWD